MIAGDQGAGLVGVLGELPASFDLLNTFGTLLPAGRRRF